MRPVTLCRLGTQSSLERPILTLHSRNESPLAICVDELDRIDSAKRRSDFGRRHLSQQRQKLPVTKWLTRQRMLRAALEQVRDVAVGKSQRFCAIGQEGREERIDSWHVTLMTTEGDKKSRRGVRLLPTRPVRAECDIFET